MPARLSHSYVAKESSALTRPGAWIRREASVGLGALREAKASVPQSAIEARATARPIGVIRSDL